MPNVKDLIAAIESRKTDNTTNTASAERSKSALEEVVKGNPRRTPQRKIKNTRAKTWHFEILTLRAKTPKMPAVQLVTRPNGLHKAMNNTSIEERCLNGALMMAESHFTQKPITGRKTSIKAVRFFSFPNVGYFTNSEIS
jgi:hypothetical protein